MKVLVCGGEKEGNEPYALSAFMLHTIQYLTHGTVGIMFSEDMAEMMR